MADHTDEVPMDHQELTQVSAVTPPKRSTMDKVLDLLREANDSRNDQGQRFEQAIDRQSERFLAALNTLTWRYVGALVLIVLVYSGIPLVFKGFGFTLNTLAPEASATSAGSHDGTTGELLDSGP